MGDLVTHNVIALLFVAGEISLVVLAVRWWRNRRRAE